MSMTHLLHAKLCQARIAHDHVALGAGPSTHRDHRGIVLHQQQLHGRPCFARRHQVGMHRALTLERRGVVHATQIMHLERLHGAKRRG
ncbi:MAG: hypothetical protein LW625_09930 [Planctomycetaceae bacterium]|nr:hypothetical protein [Planctomycetaceae bacterium]